MNNLMPCIKCGISGMHACVGYRIPPLSDDDKIRLKDAIKKVKLLRKDSK